MKNNVDELIEKYKRFFPIDSVAPAELVAVQHRLSVVLPSDLKAISSVFGGNTLSLMPQLAIGMVDHCESITQRTLAARNGVSLPHEFIILAEFDESSVLMETKEDAELPTPVIWLDSCEVGAIAKVGIPVDAYRMYPSYTDYFSMLLSDQLSE